MDAQKIKEQKQEQMRILAKYASVINCVLNNYNRKSVDETMMVKSFRKSNIETTNRKTHAENVEAISTIIAETVKLNLNVPVVKLMADKHDIGHTFLGHSGEWWLSELKKNLGLGVYVHNSLGARDLMYTKNVKEEIRKTAALIYTGDENSKDPELDKLTEGLWIIFDGINSHNGELSEYSYSPNFEKTEADFEREVLDCHIIEGYDRKLVPATLEACLMRLCDKISYIPFDMVDGLKERMITELDEEYIDVLVPILTANGTMTAEDAVLYINKSVIKENYQELATTLQAIFIKNVIDNSSSEKIAMSKEMSKLMHKLRDINNRKVVDFVLMKEDHEVYPVALKELMYECSGIIMSEGILSRLDGADEDIDLSQELIIKYKDTPYIGFIKYIANINHKDFCWTKNMALEARKHAISTELDEALENAKGNKKLVLTKGQEDRFNRIRIFSKIYKEQIREMQNKGFTLEDKDYEKMKQFQMENFAGKLYKDEAESLSLEFACKYLATLSDSEFMNLIRETGKVTDSKYASLTRKYKDIDLPKEFMKHGQWEQISETQKSQTNKNEEQK